ncbi:HSP20-like chaperone [Cercophora newfieldiana]|uniref:HSP20-like chaperone n=1 Tax=Cercophora newfieldiana TaxID=92897 RepID=A0AA39YAT7_9PEZI|nr:HSP20-like chaperone [Cercophora newfieldiana]
MAAYITRHLPHLPAPRHLTSIHSDGLKTTIIPPLPLSPPPTATTTSPTTPPPEPSPPALAPAPTNTHVFDQDTFAHFLHAFHEHYNPYPSGTQMTTPIGTTHPHFDLVESKTTYTIYGELPGLKRSDVHVETNDLMFTVTISGVLRRSIPAEVENLEAVAEFYGGEGEDGGKDGKKDVEGGLHWHVQERQVGTFKRQFHLPMGLGNMAKVKASMEDGLLTVSVPKTVAEVYREGVQHRRKVVVGDGVE